MTEAGSSSTATGAGTTTVEIVGPPPAKRTRIEAISGTGNAAANALDLDSDSVPDQLKCPICKEVPLGQVIQCGNGHPICAECQLKSGKVECTQCRGTMKNASGVWMRVRIFEELLDSLWFACPFRGRGCSETLSRAQVQGHKDDCSFNPERVQVCKYFEDPNSCNYWTNTAKPEEAIAHLKNQHQLSVLVTKSFQFSLGESPEESRVEGVVTKRNGATYLTIAWSDGQTGNVSFACIRMDKTIPGQAAATKMKLTLERQGPGPRFVKVPHWKLIVPIVSVLEAPRVLEYQPGSVSKNFLKAFLDNKPLSPQEENPENAAVVVKVVVTIS